MQRIATAVVLLAALSGCAGTAETDYTDALKSWDNNQYSAALTGAQKANASAVKANDAEVRDKSQYLMGLASYQMGKLDDASRSFSEAAKSSNTVLAGRATAMLGAVALEQGRWSDAASLYDKAAAVLPEKEAEEARQCSRNATSRAQQVRASTMRNAGGGGTPNGGAPSGGAPSVATPSGATPATGSLTIVAGTFSSEVAARQRATTLTEAAQRAGLGAPRVVASSAPDRRVWIVEIGAFADRTKADVALKTFPAAGCVVAPSQRK